MAERQYHIVFGTPVGADKVRAEAAAGERPRHFMLEVAERLGARLWEPDMAAQPRGRTLADRIARIGPAQSAMSEVIADTAGDDDVVFCLSEGASLPIADRFLKTGRQTKLATFAHNLLRPRMTALSLMTGVLLRHDAIYVVSPLLAERLQKKFGDKVQFIREQTDDRFFAPGPSGEKTRPIIMGVGMEQRDYKTLAAAAGDLDLDIRISGFSKDTAVNQRTLPSSFPENMEQRFYEWRDLAQLYRDADIVVAPVFDNAYAAGITTILEGMAAGRPVIATRSRGLANLFADEAAVAWVPPGDSNAMKSQIVSLLKSREERETLIARGTKVFTEGHTFDGQAAAMVERLKAL